MHLRLGKALREALQCLFLAVASSLRHDLVYVFFILVNLVVVIIVVGARESRTHCAFHELSELAPGVNRPLACPSPKRSTQILNVVRYACDRRAVESR